ncbi:MAG: carboxypeptidase M32 [Chloroflexota bacterium]
MGEKYDALLTHLTDVMNIRRANALLNWDMETQMPPKGAAVRGSQMETLSRIGHEMFTGEQTAELIDGAAAEVADNEYDSKEASMIRVVKRDYDDAIKLPADFVAKFTALTARAHHSWKEAREASDFSIFKEDLEQIVEMSRQRAEYIGYEDSPYDALLYNYENSLTTADVQGIFEGHRGQLVDLVAAITEVKDRVSDHLVRQIYPIEIQRKFGRFVSEAIGYDYERGRIDDAVHPFSMSFSKNDSRITTRFSEDWLNPALFGTMHECGHSMYEQGISDALDNTMLGRGTSLSVHESQSRTWENLVGRSRGFWQWAFPTLVEHFPEQLNGVEMEDFYKSINTVSPSYIRVEADECTYNLHIMLRFEIEQKMINGEVEVKHVPELWNTTFNEFFGITPPNDTLGCLQDIHWSMGGIGYFSTYALGNLLGVQYYNKAVADVPSIPQDIAAGNFQTLLHWQNDNIHAHGRKYDTKELTQRITGEEISSQPYIEYLTAKFSDIYDL